MDEARSSNKTNTMELLTQENNQYNRTTSKTEQMIQQNDQYNRPINTKNDYYTRTIHTARLGYRYCFIIFIYFKQIPQMAIAPLKQFFNFIASNVDLP